MPHMLALIPLLVAVSILIEIATIIILHRQLRRAQTIAKRIAEDHYITTQQHLDILAALKRMQDLKKSIDAKSILTSNREFRISDIPARHMDVLVKVLTKRIRGDKKDEMETWPDTRFTALNVDDQSQPR